MNTTGPLEGLQPGMRAVVRHRIPEGLTDSVGTIEALDEDAVTVLAPRGRTVIPRADVMLAKEVPPKPSRRGAPHRAISMEDLERVMVEVMPPLEREALGAWLLRAGGGYTRRANSLLALGESGRSLPEAVERARRWYADRDLPLVVALCGPVGFGVEQDPLGEELLARGCTESGRSVVLTAASAPSPLTAAPARRAAAPDHTAPDHTAPELTVSILTEPDERWWAAGDGRADRSPQVRSAAERILTGSPEQLFLLAELGSGDDRVTVGAARVAFARVWSGVSSVQVAPEHRRAGIASALMAEAAAQARSRHIRAMHLQVQRDNPAALALYERLGYLPHHEYAYLQVS